MNQWVVDSSDKAGIDTSEELFRHIVSTYYGDILRRSRNMVGDNSVFDVTQETFLEAYNSIKNLESPASVKSWLQTLHRRTVSRYIKGKRFPKKFECQENDGLEQSMSEQAVDSFADAKLLEGKRQLITAILSELEPIDSELLQCLYWEGYSVKEAAEKFDLSESNVKVKAHRLKKSLVERMQAKGSD